MLTENDLNELERLSKVATPRPWNQGDYVSDAIFSDHGMILFDDCLRRRNWINNIAYIVAACNTVPDLITEYRALQKKVQKLEQQMDWLVNELCMGAQCDFPSQVECEYRTERGYYCPERNEKFKCWIAHAEQATKE
jgi:hypothetical protein